MKVFNFVKAKAVLKSQGRSIKWLADQCGLTPVSMSFILGGKSTKIGTVKLIAIALDVPEQELYKEQGTL